MTFLHGPILVVSREQCHKSEGRKQKNDFILTSLLHQTKCQWFVQYLDKEFTLWDRFEFSGDVTIGQFIDYFKVRRLIESFCDYNKLIKILPSLWSVWALFSWLKSDDNVAKLVALFVFQPERLDYHLLKKIWWQLKPFRYSIAMWQTDRQTDGQNIARQHCSAGARNWYSNSLRPSVRLSVCHIPILYRNGLTCHHIFCSIW